MKLRAWAVAAVVMAVALSGRADLVIPDRVPVSPEDEKAVRAMLTDYVKAVAAGDRAKAVSFCQVERKGDEKLTKLGCEIDFAIARLRAAVERKLTKEAWGKIGEILGEMTPEGMKTIEIHPTASGDEVMVSWNETSKVPPEKRFTGEVGIRRTKAGWRFVLVDENGTRLKMRRWLRDTIAELDGLTVEVDQGKLKSKEELDQAVETMIKEIKMPDENEGGIQEGPGDILPAQPEMIPDGMER